MLDGKVVLITGASSGIGAATAWACSDAGATVALAARRKDRLDALEQAITTAGGQASSWQVDVTDDWQAQKFVQRAFEHHGRIDALVNNAGVMLLGPDDAPLHDWQRMVNVNLLGSMYTTHRAVSIMRQQGHGNLVFLGSVLGRSTERLSAVYCATKFGIAAFADALRKDLAPTGVRVTTVHPGRVDTELRQHIRPCEQLKDVYPAFPGLDADTVAQSIVFALTAPDGAAVSEILVRPTVSRL